MFLNDLLEPVISDFITQIGNNLKEIIKSVFLVETKIFVILYSFKSAIIIYCLLILYQFCLSEMENTGVTVAVAAPTRTLVSQAEKSGKFTGVNFKGWQQREFSGLPLLVCRNLQVMIL